MTIDQGGDRCGDRSGQVAPAPGTVGGCVPRDTHQQALQKKIRHAVARHLEQCEICTSLMVES